MTDNCDCGTRQFCRRVRSMKGQQRKPNAVETNWFAEDNADIPTIWGTRTRSFSPTSRGNYVRSDSNNHDANHDHDGD